MGPDAYSTRSTRVILGLFLLSTAILSTADAVQINQVKNTQLEIYSSTPSDSGAKTPGAGASTPDAGTNEQPASGADTRPDSGANMYPYEGANMRPESGAKAPVRDASPPDSGARPVPGAADTQRTSGAAQAPPTAAVSAPGAGHHRHDSGSQHDTPGMTQGVSMTQARPNFNLSQSVLQILLAQASPPRAAAHQLPASGATQPKRARIRDSSPPGFNAGEHALPGSGEILRSLTRALTRCLDRAPHRSQAQIGRRTARKSRFPRRPGGCIV